MDPKKVAVIAGMPRAATTFLYYKLQNHPDVFLPSRKEMDYFSVNYYRGLDWYLSFFKDFSDQKIGFDISPMYFLDENTPDRLLKFNKDIRVILIIREPVEWIFSLYFQMQKKTFKTLDFEDFMKSHNYKKDGKVLNISFTSDCIKNTIQRYCEFFGPQLLLCDYKVLNQDPVSLLNSIEKFVSVSQFFNQDNFENVLINTSSDKTSKIMNILMQQKFFADYVIKFFPKKLILSVRYKVQASKKDQKSIENSALLREKYEETAKDIFEPDHQYVSQLFANSSFIIGNGSSFDLS
jgi:hypothetical protein